jgi:purine-binding chemotaxis protein CheW
MMTQSDSPDATQTADTIYGLLTVAGMNVALPLSSLREVIPNPEHLDAMPVGAGVFLGAMELRGVIVPVVDIRKLIGAEDHVASASDVIVVINDGKHIVGLLADGLNGITQVNQRQVTPVSASRGELMLFGETFVHPELQSIVSVLRIETILGLPGVPLVGDRLDGKADEMAVASSATTHRHTLVRSGSTLFAFDIESVHTLLPECTPRPSVLSSGLCMGVVDFAGNEVPVLDVLQLFGLGSLPQDHTGPGLVVKFDDNYVVLALDSLLELCDIDLGALQPLPPFVTQRPHYFHGISEAADDLCFVVDHASLIADSELKVHASVNTKSALSGEPAGLEMSHVQAARGAAAQLTYSIGLEAATPLGQIQEILPMPELVAQTNGATFVLGVMSHRGSIVPVLSLRRMLGLEQVDATDRACLLLVNFGDGQVALAIDGLKAIDSLVWQDPDAAKTELRDLLDLGNALQRAPLINVSSHTNLIPLLDLEQFVSVLPQSNEEHQ